MNTLINFAKSVFPYIFVQGLFSNRLVYTYSMKQPDLYYFETIKMTSEAAGQILYGEYEPQASILCELWLGLWRHFYGFKIV